MKYDADIEKGRKAFAKERKSNKELQRKRKSNKRKLAPYCRRAAKSQKL